MTDKNKESLIQFAKVAGFGIACFAALIASAGVWNAVALGAIDAFYGWVAGANLIVEGFGFYSLYKKLFVKPVKKEEEEKKELKVEKTKAPAKKKSTKTVNKK